MSTVLRYVRYVLYGMLMGGADIIPGVSGGTMALVVAVYERLVKALSSAVSWGLAVLRLDGEAAAAHWDDVPWGLILPLGVGIAIAISVGARVIPTLMAEYPEQMRGLFFGLVGASLLIPALRVDTLTPRRLALGGLCAIAAFALTGLPVLEEADPGLLRVFLSAAVAICAMILPGVSGAFLLEVLGIYTPTLEAVNGLNWPYVAAFALGAAAGLASFAKLLDWLLSHFHDATMVALVGLIAGALRALWPYVGPAGQMHLPRSTDPIVPVLLLALLGFGLVSALLWWQSTRETTTASTPSYN